MKCNRSAVARVLMPIGNQHLKHPAAEILAPPTYRKGAKKGLIARYGHENVDYDLNAP